MPRPKPLPADPRRPRRLREVIKRLPCGRDTVVLAIKEGALPAIRLRGGTSPFLVTDADVDDWLERCAVRPEPAPAPKPAAPTTAKPKAPAARRRKGAAA